MVRATNKDVLVFSASPALSGNKPSVTHSLRVARPDNYEKFFSGEREYDGGSPAFSKGWLYAFVGGEEANAFCAIAFDGTNSHFFNEVRLKNECVQVEEGPCKVSYDGKAAEARFSDERRKVVWRGKGPEYSVQITVFDGENELVLTYSFERIKPEIGGYKCVFEKFGRVLSYWFLAPMRGRLTVNAKGDLEKLGYGSLKPLVGKVLESGFAYTENVHVGLPFARVGWQWSVLACQSKPGPLKPEKIVGFFDFFLGEPRAPVLPLNYQFYVVDVATGEFNVFADAESVFEPGEVPVVRVKSRDEKVKLVIQSSSPGKKRKIKGKRLANFLETADIEYRSYPSVATATINDREYKAVGTSEFAGSGKGGYWL